MPGRHHGNRNGISQRLFFFSVSNITASANSWESDGQEFAEADLAEIPANFRGKAAGNTCGTENHHVRRVAIYHRIAVGDIPVKLEVDFVFFWKFTHAIHLDSLLVDDEDLIRLEIPK